MKFLNRLSVACPQDIDAKDAKKREKKEEKISQNI
jgi:muconolactone delta-isomerase